MLAVVEPQSQCRVASDHLCCWRRHAILGRRRHAKRMPRLRLLRMRLRGQDMMQRCLPTWLPLREQPMGVVAQLKSAQMAAKHSKWIGDSKVGSTSGNGGVGSEWRLHWIGKPFARRWRCPTNVPAIMAHVVFVVARTAQWRQLTRVPLLLGEPVDAVTAIAETACG